MYSQTAVQTANYQLQSMERGLYIFCKQAEKAILRMPSKTKSRGISDSASITIELAFITR